MKNSKLLVIVLMLGLVMLTIFNNLFFHQLSYINNLYVILWVIVLVILILIFGFKKDRNIYKLDVLQLVFIYCFCFLIIIYLSGLAFGFVRNPYSLKLIKIISNILPIIIYIICKELSRYIVVSKNNKDIKMIIFIISVFSIIEIMIKSQSYSFVSGVDLFEFIGLDIIPVIMTNILLTYISLNGGYKCSILYEVIMTLYVYVIPIIPDLGIYINSILSIIFPVVLLFKLCSIFSKGNTRVRGKHNIVSRLVMVMLITLLIIVVILVSNLFKYNMMAIGSNSMKPFISKGDSVILEKIDSNYDNIKIGDVLAYHHDNKIIVHRIIEIKKKNNKLIFITKGDNNSSQDNWTIEEKDIVGVEKMVIPVVGYPTVWLSECFNK